MKRNLNVDLFRIVATFLVIVLHVLGHGGILRNTIPNSANYWAAWFLEFFSYCAVDCFALISGYVMVDKVAKVKNIAGLWFQVLFYSLLTSAIFFVFVPETRTTTNLIHAFLPIISNQWWYISSYFALFFFIPFLNAAINNVSRRTYKKLLLVILVVICFLDCFVLTDAFMLNYGYSAAWLIIMYLFGAYIKKYDFVEKFTALKGLIGFFAMVLLTLLSKAVICFASKSIPALQQFENMFMSYTSITILGAAVCLFMFCLNVKIGGLGAKLIGLFSPVTLGVYLIHVHPFVYTYVLANTFATFSNKPVVVMVLYVLAVSLVIFAVCFFIELLRIQLFRLIKVSLLCQFIDKKSNSLYQKFLDNK